MEWLPPCCDMSRLGDRQVSRRVNSSPLREEEEGWRWRRIVSLLPSPFWKYIFIPAFSLVNTQGYWSCRSLSERSSIPFLVVPFVPTAWHLSADDWSTHPRERGTLAPSRRDEGDVAFKQSRSRRDGSHSELLQMIIQNFFFKPTLGGRKKKTLFNEISEMWMGIFSKQLWSKPVRCVLLWDMWD